MLSIVRSGKEIAAEDRPPLERLLGQPLQDEQQLVIQVLTAREAAGDPGPALGLGMQGESVQAAAPRLPEWCNVYQGLRDDEIAAIEEVALARADLSRFGESPSYSRAC